MAENSEGYTCSKSGSPVAAVSTQDSGKKGFIKRLLGTFSHLGHLIFGSSNDDLEKMLKYISKEEESVHKRLMQRSQTWRKLARALAIYSIMFELLFLGIGIITKISPELSWQQRAVRILPVFAFPALAALLYSICAKYHRMCEHKDQKTLERLCAQRQAKIDELKERTNYYLTQQLIQRYDTDQTAKAAAASVLASRVGAEAGLKIAFESFNEDAADMGEKQDKHGETEVSSTGVRRWINYQQTQTNTERSRGMDHGQGRSKMRRNGGDVWVEGVEVEHYKGKGIDGSWIARLVATLFGENPTQCYALICGKCHMHNGLARKEEFPHISYYCPHCHALNSSKQLAGEVGGGIDNPGGATSVYGASVSTVTHGALKPELKVD